MIFNFYNALALELLALVAGTFLVIWVSQEGVKCCKKFGRFVGYLVMVVAVLSMICTVYHGFKPKKKYSLERSHRKNLQMDNLNIKRDKKLRFRPGQDDNKPDHITTPSKGTTTR